MNSKYSTPHPFQTASRGNFPTIEGAGDNKSLQRLAHTGGSFSEHSAGDTPSPAQQAAVGVLLELGTQVILAWLTILRSSNPTDFQSELLSSDQVAALIELKDCPNSLIEVWLHDACQLAGTTAPQLPHDDDSKRFPGFPVLSALQDTTADYTARSSTISGTSNSVFEYPTGYSTPSSAYAQTSSYPSSLNDISQDQRRSFSLAPPSHPHGCPICQKDKTISTCDGWKRHMKEHETIYPCNMCAASGKSRSYTRRINLLHHLKTHGFPHDDAGSTLADTWKKTLQKKYFGCGFCVLLFTSLMDQLNHIDVEHFRKLQSISEWDCNKVIKGLLMQPGLFLMIQGYLGPAFAINENLSWNPSAILDLQLRLELSSEATEDLASLIVTHIDWNLGGQDSALGSGHTQYLDAPTATSSLQQIATPNDGRNLMPGLALPRRVGDLQNRQFSNPFTTPDQPGLNILQQQPTVFDSQTENSINRSRSSQQVGSGSQVSPQSENDCMQGELRRMLSSSQIGASPHINEHSDDSILSSNETSFSGGWPSNPLLFPSNPNTTPSSTNPTYQPTMSPNTPRVAGAEGGLPSTTGSSGPTVAHVLSVDAQLKKQRSRKKLANHYGAPDLDFEQLQHLMRDHDRSRSAKRQL